MQRLSRSKSAKLAVAFAAVGLVLTPAIATGQVAKKRPQAISLSIDPISGFTPANADPKLAAALASRGTSLSDFKFTPAAPKGRPSQIRVAIRARAVTPAQARVADAATAAAPVTALAPASYNLGVAVGWRRFAVSADVARSKEADPALGGRESAAVGVSYSLGNRLTTRVAVGAERDDGKALSALRKDDNVSVDVGGAYAITRNIAVTGGVRYRIDHDRVSALRDDRRDSQAVYVGTAFKF
ncbi:MAG TPA: porin [Sphingomicrobium sp.]|nr:porin [Sphingomicrobium sp.]